MPKRTLAFSKAAAITVVVATIPPDDPHTAHIVDTHQEDRTLTDDPRQKSTPLAALPLREPLKEASKSGQRPAKRAHNTRRRALTNGISMFTAEPRTGTRSQDLCLKGLSDASRFVHISAPPRSIRS